MEQFIRWFLGITHSPDMIEGGSWTLRCQALPEGVTAVGYSALAVLAIVGVWWLYRVEGRVVPLATRLLMIGLRLAVLACVAGMLLELVVVITKKEHVPSQLLVLVDDSESMGLQDPYGDQDVADRTARAIGGGNESLTADQLRSRPGPIGPGARRRTAGAAGRRPAGGALSIFQWLGTVGGRQTVDAAGDRHDVGHWRRTEHGAGRPSRSAAGRSAAGERRPIEHRTRRPQGCRTSGPRRRVDQHAGHRHRAGTQQCAAGRNRGKPGRLRSRSERAVGLVRIARAGRAAWLGHFGDAARRRPVVGIGARRNRVWHRHGHRPRRASGLRPRRSANISFARRSARPGPS